MRYLQAREAWLEHEDWITNSKPDLGPGVKDRFEFGVDVTDEQYAELSVERDGMRAELAVILGDNGILLMPTVPSAAPLRDAPHESLQEFREKALELLCVSGLTGFPQITLPLTKVHGAPMGISLLGPAGSDQRLIGLAAKIMG
jgi:amidase